MDNKPFAPIFAVAIMVGCCLGLTLFGGLLMSAGLFAWLAANGFVVIAVILIPAAVYLFHRDRKKRLAAGAGRQASAKSRVPDETPGHLPRR